MAFRDRTLVFSQSGALNAPGLEQIIEGVKNLDMASGAGTAGAADHLARYPQGYYCY